MFRAKSGRSLFFENKSEQKKTQNIKINMTCGSDFRLKKLYLFLHIFVIFSRENSRLGTSPPMMKIVWSHLKPEPPMTCFRRSKNLKGHLVQSKSSKEKDTVAGCSSVEARNVM